MKDQVSRDICCSDEGTDRHDEVQTRVGPDECHSFRSIKATMSGTDATKQNGEIAAVTSSSTEAKRLPITLKSILKYAKNGSS